MNGENEEKKVVDNVMEEIEKTRAEQPAIAKPVPPSKITFYERHQKVLFLIFFISCILNAVCFAALIL